MQTAQPAEQRSGAQDTANQAPSPHTRGCIQPRHFLAFLALMALASSLNLVLQSFALRPSTSSATLSQSFPTVLSAFSRADCSSAVHAVHCGRERHGASGGLPNGIGARRAGSPPPRERWTPTACPPSPWRPPSPSAPLCSAPRPVPRRQRRQAAASKARSAAGRALTLAGEGVASSAAFFIAPCCVSVAWSCGATCRCAACQR